MEYNKTQIKLEEIINRLEKYNEELRNTLKDTIDQLEEAAEYINDLKMKIYELEKFNAIE